MDSGVRRRISRVCVAPSRRDPPEPFLTGRFLIGVDQYVKSLKARLVRIESLLKTAGILREGDMSDDLSGDEDDGIEHLSNTSPASRTSSEREGSTFPGGGDLEATSIFRVDERDDSRYFGRSCSLSILSQGGIDWIKSKTGDVSFLRLISPESIHSNPWNQWRPDVFHDLFASQVFKSLPSRSEVFSLIRDFFKTANRLFPIYNENSFMRMVEWQYTQQTCDDAARWASINMVICLAYEFRFSNSLKPEKDRDKAQLYFKNAISVFTELALRRTDLLSVQALLSMGFYLRGNSGTQSALPFITAAMRSCQRMGLHRDIPRPDLSPIEQEQRRRVFWVAFTVDQSTCLRAGNAPSQHPDDFDVPLPQETEDDQDPEMSSNIRFFRQLCRMALIKSRIYSRMYTAKALLKPPLEIYRTVKELHAELENWKRDYPFDTEPRRKASENDFLFGFASIGLHFVYYNALIMIHRIPLLLNYLILSRDETNDLKSLSKSRASKSSVICVQAARDTLKLVNNMPWGDIAWIWSLLYYVFLSAATIFSNIIRDTRHPQVREDLQSLNMAATFFATLVPGDGPNNYAGFMTRMSATLERIARIAVERDEKRTRGSDEIDKTDQELWLPGAKRQNSRATPTAHPKQRHRPTTLRNSMTPNSTSTHDAPHDAPHDAMPAVQPTVASITALPPHPMVLGIPDTIEGLPPVNSSGYVVPMSPGDPNETFTPSMFNGPSTSTTNDYTTTATTSNNNSSSNLDRTFLHEAAASNFSTPTVPSWPLAPDYTSSPLDNTTTLSPNSYQNTTNPTTTNAAAFATFPDDIPAPDLWQIPLAADMDFGSNLWAGLFPTEYNIPPQPQDPSMPILSAESFLHGAPSSESSRNPGFDPEGLGYGFVPPQPQPSHSHSQSQSQFQTQAQAQSEDQTQANDSAWPHGFLGLF
ncbi:Transcription factor [Penicillium alfredii]|uniref:Transcription factor n=1 Tax=Penicillium alfredii TaxID=1506179 RepID=A0A9W9K7C5_9EURO|nr:Transcription factor [Penicillium alfredii]KAJ5095833.1 Transcription factor [Penicillium alfredii]